MIIQPSILCSTMKEQLQKKPIDELWHAWSAWAETLVPFWQGSIHTFAENTGLPPMRKEMYLTTTKHAFAYMDSWRFENIPYVKARRNEIDSAISFVRNTALNSSASHLLIAPAVRNASSALRTTLQIATRGYSDELMPVLIAKAIYSLAEARTFFPVDTSDLIVPFLPKGKGLDGSSENYSEDNYHEMLDRAAAELNIQDALQRMYAECEDIWHSFLQPTAMVLPHNIWDMKNTGLFVQTRNASMHTFHAL